MTASVASFLAQAQKKGTDLPLALSGALLLAAVRLSEKKMQAVRPYQLLVDDDGALDLLTGEPPIGDGYAAPELRNGAVLPEDPRVLVYAIGALGYELITLTPPRPEGKPQELRGPFAPVIRKAMADRQQRYKSLADMARAIERIQGRPSREEERLILAAVAASTPLPAAQKLAKIELGRASAPEEASEASPSAAEPQPAFTQIWDPLEPQGQPEPALARAPAAQPEPLAFAEALRAELQAEQKARRELAAALESRIQEFAQLGMRLSLLEEQVRSSLPPPLPPAASLARDAMQLLEQRRFVEAERALLDPRAQNDAVLQFALGQAQSSIPDADGSRASRAEAAFRRAAELDRTWAQPRARLGALLWRLGRKSEARAQFEAALKLDPTCPEALAVLSLPRPRPPAFAVSAGVSAAVSALAAAAVVLGFRPWRSSPAAPAGPSLAASVVAAPQLPPLPLPPPATGPAPPAPARVASAAPARDSQPAEAARAAREPVRSAPEQVRAAPPSTVAPKARARLADREGDPDADETPVARPEKKKKVAPSPGNRAAAEAQSARGDKSLRAFDTKGAEAAFTAALKLEPNLPSAHRGMGMVYVLLGRNAEAKAEYSRYLQLAPDAPDRDQIARLLAR